MKIGRNPTVFRFLWVKLDSNPIFHFLEKCSKLRPPPTHLIPTTPAQFRKSSTTEFLTSTFFKNGFKSDEFVL